MATHFDNTCRRVQDSQEADTHKAEAKTHMVETRNNQSINQSINQIFIYYGHLCHRLIGVYMKHTVRIMNVQIMN